jgi:hypothetical protein
MISPQALRGLDAAEPRNAKPAVLSGVQAADSAQDGAAELRQMRLRTDSSASSASLAEYLRRCGCIVTVIDGRIIDATAKPEAFAAPHADIELEGYLKVWQAMNPQALVERLALRKHP